MASNKITGGLEIVCGRPTLALSSALVQNLLMLFQEWSISYCIVNFKSLNIKSKFVNSGHFKSAVITLAAALLILPDVRG